MEVPSNPSPKTTWQIALFGGLRVTRNGQVLPQPPHRSLSLLVALCLHPTLRRREQLVGLLFPDFPENVAKARLSDRLWLLKNALPEFPFEGLADEIRILPGQVWVDVDEFRALTGQNSLESLSQAVNLYTDDLLPELDDEWLLLERENLRILYARALQQVASQFQKVDEPYNAIPALEKLRQVEPFEESSLRSLMRAYQAVGQRGAALAVFERFRIQLLEEMKLEPEPATFNVVDAIRSQVLPSIRRQEIPLPAESPTDLLRHLRPAIWQGDFASVRLFMETLRKSPGRIMPQELDALEIEWALLSGDLNVGSRLIEKYQEKPPRAIAIQSVHLALELKDFDRVVEQGKTMIVEAHRLKDVLSETLLLVYLGFAHQRTGNALEAMRCANQCITLAETAGLPYPLTRGYQLKGYLLGSQGFDRDAIEVLHHAAAHAEENGYLPLLVKIGGNLGAFYQNAGKYHIALKHYDNALQIARDLGLLREEAELLHNRGVVYSALGEIREGILASEEARAIFQRLGDELGMARNTYHLAFTMAFDDHSDLDRILSMSREALSVFQAHRSLGWVASCYALVSYVHWLRHEPDEAILACQEAIPIYQKLEELDYIPELYGYIGLALLDKDAPEKALEYTSKALDESMRGELYDIASEIYYAHASALSALGREEEAGEYFLRGYEIVLKFAEQIEDPDARQAFFLRDPTMRRLMEQVYARGIAQPPRQATSTIVSRQRPALQVSLTVDAGASDRALKNASGEVALRRERLKRILHEADLQGGQPSISQIAALMNVSNRTILRDLACLKEAVEK